MKEIAEKELKLQQEIWEQQRKLQQLQQERKQEQMHQSTAGMATPAGTQELTAAQHTSGHPGSSHKQQNVPTTQPGQSTSVKLVCVVKLFPAF